jgi:S-adenosyl methyltransferase
MSADNEVAGPQSSAEPADEAPGFDTSVAHSARVHDYWLGGKENYAADHRPAPPRPRATRRPATRASGFLSTFAQARVDHPRLRWAM